MITLGLDISTSSTGYAIYNDGLIYGCIKSNKKHDEFTNLINLKSFISNLIYQYNPDIINIEAPAKQFNKYTNANTLNKLTGWNYVIFIMCKELNPNTFHINVNTARAKLRKKANLTGRLKKEDVPNAIEIITGKEFKKIFNRNGNIMTSTYDMSDACALALFNME
jgi:Holliday junction resolvasome RuvABC endonuclease subunit